MQYRAETITAYVFIGIYLAVSAIRSYLSLRQTHRKPSVLSLLLTYEAVEHAQTETQRSQRNLSTFSRSSYSPTDSLFLDNKQRLFFDVGDFLLENTCLEELKELDCCMQSKERLSRANRSCKHAMKKVLVAVLEYCVCYLLPLQILCYLGRENTASTSGFARVIFTILIMVLDSLRLFSNIFLVSFMSSRQEFMRMSSDQISKRWIYKKLKFHLYRALYLTAAFQILKNIAIEELVKSEKDPFEIALCDQPDINIVVLMIYCLRYIILIVVLDIRRSSESDLLDKNQAVQIQRRKLTFIKGFLQNLPGERELSELISRQTALAKDRSFEQIQKELQKIFVQKYENFSRDFTNAHTLEMKTSAQPNFPKAMAFTIGIAYNVVQTLFFIICYVVLMGEMQWDYMQETIHISRWFRYLFMLVYALEILVFPEILSRILRTDVSFNPNAISQVFSPKQKPRDPQEFQGNQQYNQPLLTQS